MSEVSAEKATASAKLGSIDVRLTAAPAPGDAVRCALECNGRGVIITFRADGTVDVDV